MNAVEEPGQSALVQVETCLRDGRYVLVEFHAEGKGYVFLYDADQHSLFLGQETQAVDLISVWREHLRDKAYCLPCNLMLLFEKRWLDVPGYPSVELGIDPSTARALIESLKANIPFLERVTVQDEGV